MKNVKIDYDVVSEFAGHQPNRQVEMAVAVEDIHKKVKEMAMQLAINGEFQEFATPQELGEKLEVAQEQGANIRLYDENIGG